MVNYRFSNVSVGESCIGLFTGDALPNQFSMIKAGKTPVTVYLFNIESVSSEGVEVSNPMDKAISKIPLEQITRLKTVSGTVVELVKYEPVTKEEIVKYFMETEEPALELINDDLQITFTSMTISKGTVNLSYSTGNSDISIPITELQKRSIIKLGK